MIGLQRDGVVSLNRRAGRDVQVRGRVIDRPSLGIDIRPGGVGARIRLAARVDSIRVRRQPHVLRRQPRVRADVGRGRRRRRVRETIHTAAQRSAADQRAAVRLEAGSQATRINLRPRVPGHVRVRFDGQSRSRRDLRVTADSRRRRVIDVRCRRTERDADHRERSADRVRTAAADRLREDLHFVPRVDNDATAQRRVADRVMRGVRIRVAAGDQAELSVGRIGHRRAMRLRRDTHAAARRQPRGIADAAARRRSHRRGHNVAAAGDQAARRTVAVHLRLTALMIGLNQHVTASRELRAGSDRRGDGGCDGRARERQRDRQRSDGHTERLCRRVRCASRDDFDVAGRRDQSGCPDAGGRGRSQSQVRVIDADADESGCDRVSVGRRIDGRVRSDEHITDLFAGDAANLDTATNRRRRRTVHAADHDRRSASQAKRQRGTAGEPGDRGVVVRRNIHIVGVDDVRVVADRRGHDGVVVEHRDRRSERDDAGRRSRERSAVEHSVIPGINIHVAAAVLRPG